MFLFNVYLLLDVEYEKEKRKEEKKKKKRRKAKRKVADWFSFKYERDMRK